MVGVPRISLAVKRIEERTGELRWIASDHFACTTSTVAFDSLKNLFGYSARLVDQVEEVGPGSPGHSLGLIGGEPNNLPTILPPESCVGSLAELATQGYFRVTVSVAELAPENLSNLTRTGAGHDDLRSVVAYAEPKGSDAKNR